MVKPTIRSLVRKLEVPHKAGLSVSELMLSNDDLKPVEVERRQWGPWNFVAFWVADSFNINTWMIASVAVQNGVAWWQAWLTVWIGYSIAAIFICATGRIGATYHISFPVASRASFGIWGALWPVFNRGIMACIWYGVQAWIGGTCVRLMMQSMSGGRHTETPPIHRGGSVFVPSGDEFIPFFLFWLGSLPFLWFPVHKIRHLFTVKAYVVPVAGAAFFVWATVRAQGIGPIVHRPAKLAGSALVWEIVKGIMSSIANFATLIVNDPDFARFARRPDDALWAQLFTIPISFALTSFIGIIVSSSSYVIYGEAVWSPLALLEKFLADETATTGTRFGVFSIAAAFALAQLGTNIAANSIAAGTDLSALLPRFINVRRGSYICAVVGLAMCPWVLFRSTSSFTTYLSSYSVFLSSIAGVIVCDYYWVRCGYLQTHDLYSAAKIGPYYYSSGVSWRAYAAYAAGVLINLPGFIGAIGFRVPTSATYIYNLNYFCGFSIAAMVYALLCRWFPVPACHSGWLEVGEEADDERAELLQGIDAGSDEACPQVHRRVVDQKLVDEEVSPYGAV